MRIPKEENTEKKILAAAREVFHRKGFEGARMQEIADLAGVNKALLHYYYRDKQKLFHAVFRETFPAMIREMTVIFSTDEPLETKISNFFNRHISFLQQNSYIPYFIISSLQQNHQELPEMLKNANPSPYALIRKQLDQEQRSGITEEDFIQFYLNLLSLSVFPFLAKPLIANIFDLNDEDYQSLMEKRKKVLPELLIKSIPKK